MNVTLHLTDDTELRAHGRPHRPAERARHGDRWTHQPRHLRGSRLRVIQ